MSKAPKRSLSRSLSPKGEAYLDALIAEVNEETERRAEKWARQKTKDPKTRIVPKGLDSSGAQLLRRWHLRLRKKDDALREKDAAIEKIKDPIKRQKEWSRQSKRSLAVMQESADYVRALTDHALGWTAETKKPARITKKRVN